MQIILFILVLLLAALQRLPRLFYPRRLNFLNIAAIYLAISTIF